MTTIAARMSSSSTSTISSTSARTRSKLAAIGSLIASPPAIVLGAWVRTGRPASMLTLIAGAPLAHTPTTRVSGECSFTHRAIPAISAPSPTCHTVSSVPARSSSTPIVPCPSAIAAGSPSLTSLRPGSRSTIQRAVEGVVDVAVHGGHVCPKGSHPGDLAGAGRGVGEDVDADAMTAPGIGEPDAPVARGGGHQPLIEALETTDEVVRAAALEAPDRADVLELYNDVAAERLGQRRVRELRRVQQRRVDRSHRFLNPLQQQVDRRHSARRGALRGGGRLDGARDGRLDPGGHRAGAVRGLVGLGPPCF